MIKKAVTHPVEHDQTQEVTASPVVETATNNVSDAETAAIPVIETEVEAPSGERAQDCPDLISLELQIVELQNKFVKFQTELDTLLDKKKKKRESKAKKVKCKCKDKKVDITKCKCKLKKLDK